MKRIRLAVADDHRLFLEGIRVALESADDIEIVGEADSGSKLVTLVANTRPDHVLMDYAMPQLDGLACLRHRQRFPDLKVALLSPYRDPDVIEAALRRAASAYIVKPLNPTTSPRSSVR